MAVGLSKLDVTVHLFGTPRSQAPPSGFLHYVPREDWSNFTWGEIKPATIYRKLLLEEVDVLHDWSIHPDEELIVFENGRFKRTKIGEFVDSLIERKFGKLYSTDMFDYLRLPNCADFKVFGCDYNGNISLVKVRGVARHRTVGELIEVELEGGLKIRLTPNHDLFTISNWNRIVRVKPKEGIKVVVPQRLPRELPDLNEVKGYRISDELLIAFGLWLADGCYDIAGVKFYPGYVAEEREIRQVLQKVARQYNAKFIEYPSNPLACEISSKEFKQMMVDLGFNGDACSKRVPDWVFSLSDRQVGLLLKGYFSGDGCVCVSRRKGYNVNMAQISFSTTSHQLAEDIRLLLLFLGIFTSKPLKRTNFKPKSIIRNGKVHIIKTGTVYQVSIAKGYFETFLQKVGFLHEMKNEIVRANLPKWDYGRKRHDLKLRRIKKIRKLDEKPLYLYDIELEFSDGRPRNQRYVCSEILVHNTHLHWLADWRYWRGDGKAVSTPWGNVILRPLVKRNLIAWSRYQRDLAVKQYGFPETTKYVWGGTNVEFYCPDPDKPYEKSDFILFFARMHPSKRVDIAYELARRFPNQRFVVAGSFSASPDHAYFGAYYKQAFERLPNVKIVPDVTHEEKRELYRKAKALLFPSISECFGLVAVEALSCGTPVICSRDGAFPEIVVDGKTGFLCGSLEEYERAVRNVDMLSPEACVRDARQRFSRERAAREYLEIYKKVANGEFF